MKRGARSSGLGGLRVVVIAVVLTAVALTAGSCQSQRPDRPAEVRGLADFHSHQFADVGFGGQLFTHGVDPSEPCRTPLPTTSSLRVRDMVRAGLLDQANAQAKTGECYPTATNFAGQQMSTDSLRRAWEYGLRLQVVLAVNSEFLCRAIELAPTPTCLDNRSIEAQLSAAHDVESRIDAESGGPGQGWYRIVTTPQQARDVIDQGKLAVVLGVEAANAFGDCNLQNLPPPVPGVAIVGPQPDEPRFRFGNCNPPILQKQLGASRAIARFERYWGLGARHFYLVHNVQGVAGGSAVSNPLLHGVANPSRMAPGSLFDKVADIDEVIRQVRPQTETFGCPAYEFDGGRCNRLGLTGTGLALARALSDAGAVIDVDHLSLRAKFALRDPDKGIGEHYPLVSSHSGFTAINHGDKSNEDQLTSAMLTDLIKWQGAFAPILHQGDHVGEVATYPDDASVARHECGGTMETWVQAYRYLVAQLRDTKLATGESAYPGVGYGSDFNGLAGWPHGRFDTAQEVVGETDFQSLIVGGSKTASGPCYLALGGFPASPAHVTYPFTSPMTGKSFEASVLPWSGRTRSFDISVDGVAHVGMIPDAVEELRVLGLSDAELEPLWHGAEAYLRMWEAAQSWGESTTWEQPDRRERCESLRADLAGDSMFPFGKPPGWINQLTEALRSAGCYGLPSQS